MFKIRELIPWIVAAVLAIGVAWAAQTNYLGTVFIADSTTPSQQLAINSDGSLSAGGKEVSVTGSASSATTLTNFPLDAKGYSGYSLTFTSIGSGNTVVVEESEDQSNWFANYMLYANVGGGEFPSPSITPTTSTLWYGRTHARYVRVRVSAYGSGTVTGTLTLKSESPTSGFSTVTGNAASASTDSGNPVKVGGVYESTPSTVTDAQRKNILIDNKGQLRIAISDWNHLNGGNLGAVVTPAAGDAQGAALNGLIVKSQAYHYNGSTLDRVRTNMDGTGLASAARTTTTNSGDITNYNATCVHVVLDVTSAGTGSITLTVQGKDALSSQYYTLLAGAAVTTVSTNVYKVCPGITATANVSAADIVPRTWRILVTHNNANSITYSVGYSLIL